MANPKFAAAWICLTIGFAVSACQYPDPYVFTPREFDRSSPNFRKPLSDRTSVTVCAKPFAVADERIASLADRECRKFGKTAQQPDFGFGVCPMLLASAITFRCIAVTS